MAPDLIAVSNIAAEVNGTWRAGEVLVRSSIGNWTLQHDSGTIYTYMGQGLAFLADEPRNITWLAVASTYENNSEGAVYLFPLDVPPPP